MFTGLVEETAATLSLTRGESSCRLLIQAPALSPHCRQGESIAVNGCCLTIAEPPRDNLLSFDLLEETLRRTNLGELAPGDPVNLERALAAGGRLGGHFVQGHIDCTSSVRSWTRAGQDHRLEITLPPQYAAYIIEKGSIAVDGISLTVAELTAESFTLWIIPHTLSQTNLSRLTPGARVNLEFDLLAKYVARIISLKPPE